MPIAWATCCRRERWRRANDASLIADDRHTMLMQPSNCPALRIGTAMPMSPWPADVVTPAGARQPYPFRRVRSRTASRLATIAEARSVAVGRLTGLGDGPKTLGVLAMCEPGAAEPRPEQRHPQSHRDRRDRQRRQRAGGLDDFHGAIAIDTDVRRPGHIPAQMTQHRGAVIEQSLASIRCARAAADRSPPVAIGETLGDVTTPFKGREQAEQRRLRQVGQPMQFAQRQAIACLERIENIEAPRQGSDGVMLHMCVPLPWPAGVSTEDTFHPPERRCKRD